MGQLTIAREKVDGRNPFDPDPESSYEVVWQGECINLRAAATGGEGESRDPSGEVKDYLMRCAIAPEGTEVIQEGYFAFASRGQLSVDGVVIRCDRRLTKRVVILMDCAQSVPFDKEDLTSA